MKSLIIFLSCILALLHLCSIVYALELDPNEFMTIDKIKPGMKGIGKTVFSGTKIEEFQVEVLEVVKNAVGPKSDIIWVLCSGGPLEETGVISGMSGSPIYIDGKLIGAIAYRTGSFAKRPIAGVTPIADMLRIIESEEKESPIKQSSLGELYFPSLNAKLERESAGDPLESPAFDPFRSLVNLTPVEESPSSIAPIQTPLTMAGFEPEVVSYIAPALKKLGMIPLQGGGTSETTETEEVPLEPGAVIGIQFVRGDASAYSSGTVTYVHDDKVLAFGHPLVGMGKTSLPVAVGKISLLNPSLMASSKYGSPVKTIGTLVQDNERGIMSVTGKQPEFIPVKIRFSSQRGSKEYNFEVAKHKLFSPTYIFLTTLNTIYSAEKSLGDYTMKIHSEINMKGYPTISKDNIFSGTSPDIAAAEFAAPIYSLMQNRFEEVDIENVLLEISFEDKRTNALIDNVRISKDRVKPGDSLEITTFITPYMQDTEVLKFEIIIPKDVPEGRSLLRIGDASSSSAWERARAPMKTRISDLSHLIQQIQEEESNNDIIVELFTPKVGVTIKGQELPALPLTAFNVMNSSKQTGDAGVTSGTIFMKQRVRTNYVISGSATLPLIIDRDAP